MQVQHHNRVGDRKVHITQASIVLSWRHWDHLERRFIKSDVNSDFVMALISDQPFHVHVRSLPDHHCTNPTYPMTAILPVPYMTMSQSTHQAPPMPRRYTAPDTSKVGKKSPPRNTKSWTLEDERALLQGRLERIPYKQIGARIGKTDLACRLHFHQMVMAKRTPDTPPGRSIVFLSSEHPPEVHRLAPTQTTFATSMALSSVCGPNSPPTSDRRHLDAATYQEPYHRRSHSSPGTPHSGFGGWQPINSPYSDTHRPTSDTVDISRLNNIYRAHAGDFWSKIAATYSGETSTSPSELEKAFLRAQASEDGAADIPRINITTCESPISTGISSHEVSPRIPQHHGTRHVRSVSDTSIAGRCSVESLLNHGRD